MANGLSGRGLLQPYGGSLFFPGDGAVFEAITHEHQCSVQVLSPAFEERLCELGSWADMSDEIPLPLFSLDTAEGWKQYKNGRPCEGLR